MKPFLTPLVLAATALLFFSCDRERSNPIDPQSSVLAERPSTPTGLAAQDDVGRILVAWQGVDEGDLAGYGIYRSEKSNGTYVFVPGDGDSTLFISTGKTTFIDSLTTPGVSFFYRVTAVDSVGLVSERSNFVGATVLEDLKPPETPLNLSVVADAIETDRIVVRWTAPRVDSDGSTLSGLSGFVVFRAEDAQGGFVAIDTLGGDAQELIDRGLKALTTYAYRVMAFDAAGNKSQLTAQQQIQTRGLEVPPNLSAVGQIGQIEIAWGSIESLDLLGYHVFRSIRADDGFERLPSVEGSPFTTGQTTYIDSNLAGGQVYFYKVQAVGKSDLLSEMSGSAGAEALADELAPGAPNDVSAVPNEADFNRVLISWNATLRDATGGPLTGVSAYVVYRSEETSTSFVRVGQVDSNTFEFLDENAVEATTYFYAVTAIDASANEGPRTSPIQIRTNGPDKVAPQAPQNISAVPDFADFGTVVVRWSPASLDVDGGELTGLVAYVVFRSENGTDSFVPVDTLDATAREYVDVGLESLTTYSYTVSAYDETGNEGPRGSAVQVRTEGPDRIAPQVPGNLSASADELETGRITIRWSRVILDADGGELTGLAGYVIFRAEDGNSFVPIDSVHAEVREYIDRGLISLTNYTYRILAYDESGNESPLSNTAQAQTSGLAVPDGLVAVAGIRRIELDWQAVTDTDLLGYNVFRSMRSDQGYELLPSVEGSDFTTGRTAYIDSNRAEGQQFFYKVQAVAGNGQVSELSGFVDATTLGDNTAPEPPRNVAAVPDPVDFARVVVTWSPVLQDIDGGDLTALQGYAIFRSKNTNTAFVQVATVAGDIVEFVDTGLEVATNYFYAISAIDASGNESVRTGAVEARTEGPDQVAPQSPSNVSAVADEADFGRVVVRWGASIRDADGGDLTGLERYVIFRSKGTVNAFVPVDTLAAGAREYVDTSLDEFTTYFYTISAIDDSGNESARANSVQVRTEGPDQVAPESPSNLSAVPNEIDFGRVVVRWSPSVRDADGGDLTGLSGYVIFRSKGTANSFVPADTLGADAREYIDTSLQELTTYFYTISAIDDSGNESARASSVQVRTEGPDQVAPESPSNLSAVPNEADFGRVVVRWSPSVRDADGGDLTGLSGYVIFRSKGTANSFVPADTLGADAREYVDTSLEELTTYFYTISAIDDSGNESARANSVQVRTEGPDQVAPESPSNLSAVPNETDFGRAVVRWSPSVRDADGGDLTGLSGYVIFRSKGTANSFVPVDTLEADAREYVDISLEELTTYFYTISAIDDSGNESARASSVQVRTEGPDQVAPESPSNLSAVPNETDFGRVVVRWSPSVRDADGGDLTGLSGYVIFRSKGSANSFVPADTLGAESREYVDSSLEELTTYFYTISAIDDSGNESARASSVQVRTEGPDQVAPESPSNLSAVADELDFGRAVVRWSPSVRDADGGDLTGLSGYLIFRSKGTANSFVLVDTVGAGTREYVDASLEELTTYFYTISAIDDSGNESARSISVQVRTEGPDQIAPESPSNLSAVADELDFGRAVVRWSPSVRDADGGDLSGLSGYVIFRSKGTVNSFVPVDTVAAIAREFEDLNLNPLTDYFYTVTAFDGANNESARATPVQVRTEGPDQVAPATPQNVSAVPDEVEFGRIVVSWSPSLTDTDGGDLTGLAGYVVFRSKGSVNAFVPVDTLAADVRQFEDSGLQSLTAYFYALMAFDESGNESGRSAGVQVLTDGPDQVAPAAPSDLAATADPSAAQITISWSPPSGDSDGGDLTGLATYILLRSKDDATSFVALDTLEAAFTSFVDSGLESSSTYFYSVRSVDESGNASSRSATISAKTTGISAPVGVSATGDIRQITVAWTSSTDESLLGYNVYRSTRSDQGFERQAGVEGASFTTGQTAYIDSGLTGGLTFFYRISVVTNAGESSLSAFEGATVESDTRAPAAPTFIEGEPATGDPEQLSITWKAPTTDLNGQTLTGLSSYLIYRSTASAGPFTLVGTSNSAALIDTGLVAVTTYYYQVEASDDEGNVSNRSATVALTTGGVDLPSNVSISSSTPSNIAEAPTVTVSWDASVGAILYYEVQRTTVAGSATDSDFTSIEPNTLDTSRADTAVTRGTTYYYRVRARDVDDRLSDWTTLAKVEVKN